MGRIDLVDADGEEGACAAQDSPRRSGLGFPVVELLCLYRKIVLNDGPDHRMTEAEVFMHDPMTKTVDCDPVDLRPQKFYVGWYPALASPMISRLRTTASMVRESAQKASSHGATWTRLLRIKGRRFSLMPSLATRSTLRPSSASRRSARWMNPNPIGSAKLASRSTSLLSVC